MGLKDSSLGYLPLGWFGLIRELSAAEIVADPSILERLHLVGSSLRPMHSTVLDNWVASGAWIDG